MDVSRLSHYMPKISMPTPQRILNNVSKIALPAIALATALYLPGADAGIFSGVIVGLGCVGAGIVCPASLFWAAAPCYDAAMLATINPLLP